MDKSVAAFIADRLPDYGVTHVFELVGGMVTVLLDALHQNPELTIVSMHHEQSAGFAAEGFARATGRPAVALATSGPGATNLLTAVGSCYFDSVPVVFITGQVNRAELSRESGMRQGGFQETDIVSMATPVTKWATLVEDPGCFAEELDRAFRIATEGRPGPVLIDIPMDVQRAHLPELEARSRRTSDQSGSSPSTSHLRDPFIERCLEGLRHAQRPLVLAGGGIRCSGAVDQFREAVRAWKLPVVTSLLGIDALPHDSPFHVGMIGSYGNRWANWALAQSDLLLVLGSRLDVRQTGSDVSGFGEGRLIFHVDVDPFELNARVIDCDTLVDDLSDWLLVARDAIGGRTPKGVESDWLREIHDREEMWPDTKENEPETGPNPNLLMRVLSERLPDSAVFVTDVGQHQMWAAQSVRIGSDGRFLTSGGMGSMGFGLPASIGAALASPGQLVCLIAGDGGMQCNLQELQTLVRLNLPVLMVVLDNGCHGMVRQFQESYFDSRYFSTKWGYSAPDFRRIAEAYGIPAWTVSDVVQASAAIEAALDQRGPALLHVKVDETLNVYPKMAFGRTFGSMEPDVLPLEMEGT